MVGVVQNYEQNVSQNPPDPGMNLPLSVGKFSSRKAFVIVMFFVAGLVILLLLLMQFRQPGAPVEQSPAPSASTETSASPAVRAMETVDSTFDTFAFDKLKKEIDSTVYSFRGSTVWKDDKGIQYFTPKEFGIVAGETFSPLEVQVAQRSASSWISSLVSNQTTDFWYDTETQNFFAVEMFLPQLSEHYEMVVWFPLEGLSDFDKPTILHMAQVDHMRRTTILGYIPTEKVLVLDSRAGDGCGGTHKIWKLSLSGDVQAVSTAGSGCASDTETPLFIGMRGTQLLLGKMQESDQLPAPYMMSLESITALDVLSMEQSVVATARSEFTAVYEVEFATNSDGTTNKDKLVLGSQNGEILLDLLSGEVVRQ